MSFSCCAVDRAFVFARVDTLGLRAWSDDLVVVLFEFLEDDTKLAQSCTDWLYVQHWYTVVPDPALRVTLWALTGAGGNCHEHMQDTPLHFFVFLGFSPSRSACHGPLRQQALFCTRLALFRDISLFFGGHFRSEVSCGSSVVSAASWASLRGGEPCSHTRYIQMVLPFPLPSNRICLLCPAPSPDQRPSPPWSWHPSLRHDGGLCDVDQHILSGFLQLSYQVMYLSFARVVEIENDELRVSVVFACPSVQLPMSLFSVMSRSRWRPSGWKRHSRHHQVAERRACAGALRLDHYGFGSRCQLCSQDTHWLHFSVFLTLFTNTRLLRRFRRCPGRLALRGGEWLLLPKGTARAEFFCAFHFIVELSVGAAATFASIPSLIYDRYLRSCAGLLLRGEHTPPHQRTAVQRRRRSCSSRPHWTT